MPNRLSRDTVIVGNVQADGFVSASGLTGATAAARYVGATATGSPASGTFAIGDWVTTQDGSVYVCTVAGTPGTWVAAGAATAPTTITSSSANALTVGRNGTTNPQFNVDDSTTSAATGLRVKGAAAAGGLALSATSSGTDENVTLDAKGAGTLTLNGTATGAVSVGHALGVSGAATLSAILVFPPQAVSALALDVTAGVVFTKSIATASTFTASAAGTAGQVIILVIATDSTQRVATFGTNLNSSGTLTIPASKVGTIMFVSDSTSFREVGRSINL